VRYTDAECVNHGTIMPDVNPAPVRLRAEHLDGAAQRDVAQSMTATVSKGLKLVLHK